MAGDFSETSDDVPDPGTEGSRGRQSGRARKRRRIRTQPAPGSDPTPPGEPPRHAENENDARLRLDKPPHWG